jgi:hypothetical protein
MRTLISSPTSQLNCSTKQKLVESLTQCEDQLHAEFLDSLTKATQQAWQKNKLKNLISDTLYVAAHPIGQKLADEARRELNDFHSLRPENARTSCEAFHLQSGRK